MGSTKFYKSQNGSKGKICTALYDWPDIIIIARLNRFGATSYLIATKTKQVSVIREPEFTVHIIIMYMHIMYMHYVICMHDIVLNAHIGLLNGRSLPPNLNCPDSFIPPRPPPNE